MAIEKSNRDVDKYLAELPDGRRQDMMKLDEAIRRTMESDERGVVEGTFWGGSDQVIIGYGTMIYKSRSGKEGEWFAVGLALQKHYISVYITATEDKKYVVEKYGHLVGKAKVGKSNISFSSLADIDLEELMKLVAIAKRQRDEKGGVL